MKRASITYIVLQSAHVQRRHAVLVREIDVGASKAHKPLHAIGVSRLRGLEYAVAWASTGTTHEYEPFSLRLTFIIVESERSAHIRWYLVGLSSCMQWFHPSRLAWNPRWCLIDSHRSSATCSGVTPLVLCLFRAAPTTISHRTMSAWPHWHARCSAAKPLWSRASRSHILNHKDRQIVTPK